MCYSLDDANSLKNVNAKWVPEIRKTCADTPIILVGTKSDVGDISESDAQAVADEIEARAHLQTSALKLINVKETFDTAI